MRWLDKQIDDAKANVSKVQLDEFEMNESSSFECLFSDETEKKTLTIQYN